MAPYDSGSMRSELSKKTDFLGVQFRVQVKSWLKRRALSL